MNFISRFFFNRNLDSIIRSTFDYAGPQKALAKLTELYVSLPKDSRRKIWELEYRDRIVVGMNLAALASLDPHTVPTNDGGEDDDRWMGNPWEWITGTTQREMLNFYNDPLLTELSNLRELVWVTIYRADFSKLEHDQRELVGAIIRSVIREWRECL